MSTFRGPMSDAGLSLVLDHWLAEGPDSVPDRVVDAAIQAAVATRQRQWRGRLLRLAAWQSPAVPLGLTVAGVAAIVLLAISLGLGSSVNPGQEATPTPSASDQDITTPSGTSYRNPVDGYELLIPGDWEAAARPEVLGDLPGVVRFDGRTSLGETIGALTVSVGSTDGSVYVCSGLCVRRVAHTLDELGSAIPSTRSLTFGSPLTERVDEIELGGEPARLEYPVMTGQSGSMMGFFAWCSAYALHEGRPVILSFVCNHLRGGVPAGQTARDAIIESFRFVDGGWQTVLVEDAGFEVQVPDGWSRQNYPGNSVHLYGFAGGMSVRTEPSVEATSIDDLREMVVAEYQDLVGAGRAVSQTERAVEVGGVSATSVTLVPPDETTGLGAFEHVLAIHGGRPYVITWIGQEGYERTFQDILARFRFLD